MNYLLEYFVVASLIMIPLYLVGYWAYKLTGWVKMKMGGAQ